jgi:hypothetical protein
VKKKPGREVVTFLLVCNLAMWAINSLETNRADSHPIQARFNWIYKFNFVYQTGFTHLIFYIKPDLQVWFIHIQPDLQVRFYGGEWAWPIITHVSMPLAIFYRCSFHEIVHCNGLCKTCHRFKISLGVCLT